MHLVCTTASGEGGSLSISSVVTIVELGTGLCSLSTYRWTSVELRSLTMNSSRYNCRSIRLPLDTLHR